MAYIKGLICKVRGKNTIQILIQDYNYMNIYKLKIP